MEIWMFQVSFYLITLLTHQGICVSAPKFKMAPTWPDRSYYDEDGPSIRLDCLIQPGTNYTMIWTKDKDVIGPDFEQLQILNKNQSLLFEDPKQFQSGIYQCMAYNEAGRINHTGNILISARTQETRPRIIYTEPTTTVSRVQADTTVVISCTFDVGGTPEALMDLTLNWYKDDVMLADTNHTTFGINSTETNNQISSLTINDVKTADYGRYKCYGENSKGNDSKLFSVVPPEPIHKKLPLIPIIGSSAGGFVAMVTIVVVVVLRRHFMRSNKYEELEWVEPDHYDVPERKIEYDVFISYSSDDLEWVKDHLYEKLIFHGYEVCIDFKDFTPGMAVAENIIEAIYKSHKTIVLMSHNFLRSMWGQFELQQAHNKTIMKKTDALILIKYDDCKVPGKLLGKTFLDWSDLKVQPHFWNRLYEAIGIPGDFKDPTDDKELSVTNITYVNEMTETNGKDSEENEITDNEINTRKTEKEHETVDEKDFKIIGKDIEKGNEKELFEQHQYEGIVICDAENESSGVYSERT